MSWFENVSPKSYGLEPPKSLDAQQAALIQAGAFSPLWGLFYAATATGMAWWGMTRWMSLAAPERMQDTVVKLRLVKPAPPALVAAPEPEPVSPEPIVEAVAEAAVAVAEAVVAAIPEIEPAPEPKPEPLKAVAAPQPVAIKPAAPQLVAEPAPAPVAKAAPPQPAPKPIAKAAPVKAPVAKAAAPQAPAAKPAVKAAAPKPAAVKASAKVAPKTAPAKKKS